MNVVVANKNVLSTDKITLFENEEVIFVIPDNARDLPSLLVFLGIYKSTSQARQAGRTGEVPTGWTVMKASKKVELFIWNPTE